MSEIRKVRKIGDSLHVSIPPRYLEHFNIYNNDPVVIKVIKNGILIEPIKKYKEVKLCR